MKFRVIGGPLQAGLSVEAKHSDSFKAIFKKVQKAAGKSVPLDGYDLYTTATSSLTGEAVAAAGPLRSDDTPTSAQLERNREQPHILMLVQRDGSAGRGSLQNTLSCSTTAGGGDATSMEGTDSAPTSPRGQDAYRHRMRAMYLKYDPAQLHRVELALDRYRGYEEDVLDQLVKRYGPEPSPGEVDTSAAATAAAVAAGKAASSSPATGVRDAAAASYYDRLTAMYATYEPEKLSKVDGTLRRYAGREEEVLQQLVKKYGPEPAAGSAASAAAAVTPRTRTAVVSTPRTPEPAAAGGAATPITIKMSERKEGNSAATTPRDAANAADSVLVTPRNLDAEEEFGEPPRAARTLSYSERLRNMYAAYDPQKLRLVEGTLKKYKGREEAVIKQLVKIYGPEPTATSTEVDASAAAAASPPPVHPSLRSSAVEEPSAEEPMPTVDEKPAVAAAGAAEPGSAATEAPAVTGTAADPVASPPATDVAVSASEESATAAAPSHLSSSEGTSPRDLDSVSVVPAPTTPAPTGGRYRERLVALYHAYNPAKLHTVEGTLKKFAGKEEVAIQQLVRRYGPEPAPLTPEAAHELLIAATGGGSGASPASPSVSPITANMPGSSTASSPRESQPVSPVEAAQPTPADPRQRIVAILSAHEPDKVDRVDRILETYRGREEEVIAKLEMRYAATRGGADASAATQEPAAVAATATSSLSAVDSDGAGTVAAKGSTPTAVAPPPSIPATAAPSHRSSSSDTDAAHGAAAANAPPALGSRAEAAALPEPAVEAAKPLARSASRHRAALSVAATHLEGAANTAVLRRWWPFWAAHHRAKKSAALLQQGLWVGGPGEGYQLNDTVEPAYTVASLDAVVVDGADATSPPTRVFSSELQLATRALLASLRRCVESRVVEVQSSSERELADALLSHWAVPEHLCPVTDSPELAGALQQAAHLIGQLGDLMTVIRTQAGQLQQLKALHRDVVERMGHTQAHAEALDRLQAQLDAANDDKRALQQELVRLGGESAGAAAAAAAARAHASPRHARGDARATFHQQAGRADQTRRVYPTAEERKDAQIAKLQQELAKARNSLFLSKEAEEKMKVQLQHSRALEVRREVEGRHREGTSARYGLTGQSDAPGRSHSARAGGAHHSSLSNSPPRRHTPSSTPRGAFSRAIAQETPRRLSHDRVQVNGRAVSSIRKPDAPNVPDRADTSITSSTPWPSTRYVMAAAEVERGPCPNCLTPLTSCSNEAQGDATEKAAFCFSCRRSFTFGELRTRDAREAVAQL